MIGCSDDDYYYDNDIGVDGDGEIWMIQKYNHVNNETYWKRLPAKLFDTNNKVFLFVNTSTICVLITVSVFDILNLI